MKVAYTDTGAEISACEKFRYALWRTWGPSERRVAFIGLNPSTADATDDDQTIKRCVDFAQRWGFDGLFMLNLFAFRSTFPKVMMNAPDPIGPENNAKLKSYLEKCDTVVACWGNDGLFKFRDWHVRHLVNRAVHCLGKTNGGNPRHPARLAAKTPLEVFWQSPSPPEKERAPC